MSTTTPRTITRAEWDAMSGTEAMEYINAGGRVPPSPEIEAARSATATAARASLESVVGADRRLCPTLCGGRSARLPKYSGALCWPEVSRLVRRSGIDVWPRNCCDTGRGWFLLDHTKWD